MSLCLLPCAWGEKPPTCEVCGQTVHGRYYQAANRAACMECYGKYPHCPGCGMPLRAARYTRLGEPVCGVCAKRAGTCANCGDVLLGTYYPVKDDPAVRGFCQKCMDQKPKCAICGAPYRDLVRVGDKTVCRRCLKKAERCETCGAPLVGKYFTVEGLDGKFCEKCIGDKNWCDFCGRPLGRDGLTLPDGRWTCGPCSRAAVNGLDQARDLLERTIRYLASRHGMSVRMPFDFVLADSDAIARLTGHAPNAPARSGDDNEPGRSNERKGEPERRDRSQPVLRELGVFATHPLPESPRPVIAILSDLPVSAFLETAAHEYAHLWQFENGLDLSDRELAEGFAQWAAAKWLRKNRLDAACDRIAKRTDPAYGDGYRRVAEYEQTHGTERVLEWIRTEMRAAPREFRGPWLRLRERNGRAAPVPLSESLPAGALEGNRSFLKSAIVVQPATLAK